MIPIARMRAGPLCLVPVLLCGCETTVTGPELPPFQVIEETTFAAGLEIDLTQFTRLETGVYIQDVVVGTGSVLEAGTSANLEYTGWLSDGTEFDSGTFGFTVGSLETIPGFEQGMLGMKAGGTRRIIIPPDLAYGQRGSGPVPGGAIVIFRVKLLEVI